MGQSNAMDLDKQAQIFVATVNQIEAMIQKTWYRQAKTNSLPKIMIIYHYELELQKAWPTSGSSGS